MREAIDRPTWEPNPLDFRVLGPFEVVDRAGTALDLGSRKQRAVLALLVLNAPRVVPLDQLIDQLWAGEPPSSATGTLQAYISQLRRVLEPRRGPRTPARALRTREPGYLLDIEPAQVDATRFVGDADAAQAALLRGEAAQAESLLAAALRAWRGEPLVEFTEPFARSAVIRLAEVRVTALQTRMEAWLSLGRYSEAAAEVGHFLDGDPYREGFWALLIRALYRDGRQAEALAAYQRCRTLLGEELGLDPSPELRRLERAVLEHDPALHGPWPPRATPAFTPVSAPALTTVSAPVSAPAGPRPQYGPGTGTGAGAAGAGAADVGGAAGAAEPPRLVGREPHLRRIAERLDDARCGSGGLLLVTGEAGIGKTRLADGAAELAAGRGVDVAWSRCLEGSGAPAFWPWIQVLEALRDGGDDLADLASSLTGEGDAGTGAVSGVTDPDTARFLLHDAIGRALARRAESGPLMLIIDDLHWADAASLKLLTFLGGDLHRLPLLVLVTMRPNGPDAAPPLAEALGELTRHRGTERMSVGAFTPEQVMDYLADAGADLGAETDADAVSSAVSGAVSADDVRSARVLRGTGESTIIAAHGRAGSGDRAGNGQAAPRELPYERDRALAEALHERTGGNPLFLRELLRLLASNRPARSVAADDVRSIAVPDGVRDVISQRVYRLPEDTQALLRAAAVIGKDVDADVLEAATGIGAARMMTLLEPAVATGLLAETDDGWNYRFSHALVRDALYAGLTRLQRAQIHARVGEAIESRYRGDLSSRLPVLAHHFGSAARVGGAAKAVSYATEAARQAAVHLAYDEAVLFWEQALAVLDPAGMGFAARRCSLLIELGRARRVTGDVVGGRVALDEAVALATDLGDDDAVVEAATVFGGVTLWYWRAYGVVDERMVALVEQQLRRLTPAAGALSPDGAPTGVNDVRRAELLGTLGVELYYGDRRAEGRQYTAEAVALARRIGDDLLLARTLNNYAVAAWTPDWEEDRLRAVEEILTLPRLPLAWEVIARLLRMPSLLRSGRLPEYDAELARCLRITDEIRMPEIKAQVNYAAAGRALLDGRWADVERFSGTAVTGHHRTSLWGAGAIDILCRFFFDWARGRHGVHLDELAALAADPSHRLLRPTAVLAAVEAGEEELAHRMVDQWGTRIERDWAWQFTVWQWALVATKLGRPDPEEMLAEVLPIADQFVIMGTGAVSWGAMHDVAALLLARLGRTGEAVAQAERAVALHRRLGLRHLEEGSAALLSRLRS